MSDLLKHSQLVKRAEAVPAHTPGPWLRGNPSRSHILQDNSGRSLIAVVSTWTMSDRADEAEANARLIAAAPDMLAALKMLRKHDEAYELELSEHQRDQLHDAIAKAEGPQ